ncbi:MAG: preprotein translocase subunit YajC [Nocardioides sp.]
MPELASLLPFVAVALLFWLLFIRPQGRRQRELAAMQGSLKVGDEVMLTSGIFGTLRETDEDHVRVEIAEGVTIKVARGAVGTVAHPGLEHVEPEEN